MSQLQRVEIHNDFAEPTILGYGEKEISKLHDYY